MTEGPLSNRKDSLALKLNRYVKLFNYWYKIFSISRDQLIVIYFMNKYFLFYTKYSVSYIKDYTQTLSLTDQKNKSKFIL